MMKKLVIGGVLSTVSLISANVSAEGMAENVFVSANVGMSNVDLGVSSEPGISVDEDDTAFGISGGYRFNKNIAVEVGYQKLGEASISATAPFTGSAYGSTVSIASGSSIKAKGTGWNLGLIASLPVTENIEVYGKAGAFKWETKYSLSGSITVDGTAYTGSTSITEDGTDAYGGIGARYNFNDSMGLGVEYLRYKLDSTDVDVLNASFVMNF